jgi:hypothetical protein
LQYIYSIDIIGFRSVASQNSAARGEIIFQENALSQKLDFIEQPAKIRPKNLVASPDEAEVVRRILRALADLEYGSIEIIVQNSKVVQIERTQRSRFPQPLDIPRV